MTEDMRTAAGRGKGDNSNAKPKPVAEFEDYSKIPPDYGNLAKSGLSFEVIAGEQSHDIELIKSR